MLLYCEVTWHVQLTAQPFCQTHSAIPSVFCCCNGPGLSSNCSPRRCGQAEQRILLELQMLDSWPSSTTVDAEDAMHGDLSSTWSSVQQYAQEEYAEKSPGFVPTPAGMDVRASKSKHIFLCQPNGHIA